MTTYTPHIMGSKYTYRGHSKLFLTQMAKYRYTQCATLFSLSSNHEHRYGLDHLNTKSK